MAILQTRARQQGSRTVAQALVQWSDMAEDAATWEDMELLRLQFPRAPAWGQAGFQEAGNVTPTAQPVATTKPNKREAQLGARPGCAQ